MEMISLGQVEIVKKIIEKDSTVINKRDNYGNYPIIEAARCNNFEILKILVNSGAKIDVKNCLNQTTLFWVERNNNDEMKNFILKSNLENNNILY